MKQNSVVQLSEDVKKILIYERALPGFDSHWYTSNNVVALQRVLNEGGWAGDRAIYLDGMWGPETINALREYQRSKGIEQTGEVDADTKRALSEDGVNFDR